QGNYMDAITDYSEAIRLEPNDSIAYNDRGAAKCRQGDYTSAIKDCSMSILLNPNFANPYQWCGFAKANQDDHISAITDFNEAIRLNPNYAFAYNNRALSYEILGEHKKSQEDHQQAAMFELKEYTSQKKLSASDQYKKSADDM